jgi:hypothetical protein
MALDAESVGNNNPYKNAGRESDIQSSRAEPNIRPAPSAPEPPPAKTHCQITCKQEKDWWDHAKPFVEIAGILLLLVYTIYTIKMYFANRDAADAAKSAADTAAKTMRIDQRAWISPRLLNSVFKKDQPLAIAIEFDNTGKTPAIHVQTCVVAEPVESSRKDVDISCPESSKSPGFNIIFPNGHIDRLANATGQGGKTNIDPQGLLREPFMKELRGWKTIVYVYGRVDYWDVFKEPHWSTFCSKLLIMPPTSGGMPETVNWMTCETGNDVDPKTESSH